MSEQRSAEKRLDELIDQPCLCEQLPHECDRCKEIAEIMHTENGCPYCGSDNTREFRSALLNNGLKRECLDCSTWWLL